MGEAKKVLPESVELVAQSYDVLEGSSGLIVLTDWQEFRTPDFDRIAADMNEAVIFDGRNLYDPAYIQKQGIEYHGIARGKYA
jgi:UDPglucose 6-dehydrogenase